MRCKLSICAARGQPFVDPASRPDAGDSAKSLGAKDIDASPASERAAAPAYNLAMSSRPGRNSAPSGLATERRFEVQSDAPRIGEDVGFAELKLHPLDPRVVAEKGDQPVGELLLCFDRRALEALKRGGAEDD